MMIGSSGRYYAALAAAAATPYRTPQPPSPGAYDNNDDYHRLLRQNAYHHGQNSPMETFSPDVNTFSLVRSNQTLEDAFARLNVDSADYHHHHRLPHDHQQPSYWSNDAEFQSPTSVWSDHTNPYLAYEPSLNLDGRVAINSSPVMTPTFQNSNDSASDFFGNTYGVVNGTESQNSDTPNSGVSNGRRQRSQERPGFVPVERLRGTIAFLTKDQNGCRVLQNTMEGLTNAREIEMIFAEVLPHVCDLMLDPYGNYVVQKLVELCNEEQRTEIMAALTRTSFLLVTICLNMHGTRVVQKLLEHVTSQLQVDLFMEAVSPYAVALCKSANGQHVIQYCLRNFSDEDNAYLLNEVADNCIEVGTDKSGCCVLQQCVEFSHGNIKDRLVDEIITNAVLLSEDRYGNYVVQYLLDLKRPDITTSLLAQLRMSYMPLSISKYGSNVVEKCLLESDESQSSQIIQELLSNLNTASILLTDAYGNYVFQSSLSVSKGEDRRRLVRLVMRYELVMRSNLYGKKILAWLEKRRIPINGNLDVYITGTRYRFG